MKNLAYQLVSAAFEPKIKLSRMLPLKVLNQAKYGVNSDIWLQLCPSWTLQPQVVVGREPGAA